MDSNTNIRLDWVTFTLTGLDLENQRTRVMSAIDVLNGAHFEMGYELPFDWDFSEFKMVGHHKPYAWAFSPPNLKGLVIMGSERRSEVAIELQGQFCSIYPEMALRLAGWFNRALTRLDVACDIETSMSPELAVSGHTSKTVSVANSISGDTVYLGSPKSEYMARIYRYAHPHPRSGLLRSEIVYRRDFAKALGKQIFEGVNLQNVVAQYWHSRNLQHLIKVAVFPVEGVPVKVSVARSNSSKTADKRLLWLTRQIAPALAKMKGEGIELDEIIRALGLPELV